MSVQDRIRRYRESGGGADLVRVEVLVPARSREEILSHAADMRRSHRARRDALQHSVDQAIARYGSRVLDNIDLDRLDHPEQKARVLGKALMARGDARAFVVGRRLLSQAGE